MKKIFFVLMLLIFAVSCSIGPDYVRPPVEIPDSTLYVQDYTVEDSLALALADTTWWELFGDTVLTYLITTAVQENNDIKIAAARVDQYMGLYGVNQSDYYPKFDAGVSGQIGESNSQGVKFRDNRFNVSLSAFWEIDIWGKIRRANEAALADLLAAEEVRRGIILSITSLIANSYFDLLSLDTQLEIAKRTVESRAKSLELFQLRWERGDISQLEISQLESEYWYAKSQIPLLEKSIVQLENAISVLLGRNPGPIPRGQMIADLILPEIPESLPSTLLERRPDVLEAEQQLIAANARIGVVKSLYYPSLSLTGLIGFSNNDIAKLFEPSSFVWNAGGSLLAPIFRAGEISSQVESAEAIQRQAFFNYIKSVQTAFSDAQNALVERKKTEEIYFSDGKRLEAITTYYNLSNMRYEEGATSYLEVLDAERNLFNSELGYVQSRATLMKSAVGIFSSLAGGWLDKTAYESYQPMNTVEELPEPDQPSENGNE
ncbi:MAG: efflux transporter outer membrane subunit [Ignavibacteriaceae bacterium]|nr:efflux transporter outer membrane subunit [Ignavibacteriaceae bacterium]